MAPIKDDNIENTGALAYRCAQPAMFVKRSERPDSKAICKIQRAVGSTIHSTGNVWTGPSGGKWCELDAVKGEMGWMLISGPGFGLSGPALVDAEDIEKKNVVNLQVVLLRETASIAFQGFVDQNYTVGQLQKMIATETGLTKHHICLGKEPPAIKAGTRLSIDYMRELNVDKKLIDCNIRVTNGVARLFLVYVGEYPKGFQAGEPVDIQLSYSDTVQVDEIGTPLNLPGAKGPQDMAARRREKWNDETRSGLRQFTEQELAEDRARQRDGDWS